MPYCVLLRHARSTANTAGVLAGWAPDVHLDETGRTQAAGVAERLGETPVVRVVTSPLPRCRETVAPLLDRIGLSAEEEPDLGEAHYGGWTGRPLEELAKDPLWATVQSSPSRAVFPPSPEHRHESMAEMAHRAVSAVRRVDAEVAAEHGDDAVWLAVSHGDVLKAVIAEAAGVALDDFQRLVVDPASLSVVRYTAERPFVMRLNDTGVGAVLPRPSETARAGDAAVGGGAG